MSTGGMLSVWCGCGVGCRSGIIDSDKDRPLIISGYTPANMGTWMGYQPDPIFLNHCERTRNAIVAGLLSSEGDSDGRWRTGPADVKALLTGENLYMAQNRSRRLGEAVGEQSEALRVAAEEKRKAEAASDKAKSS